jgi:hypothetical protein
MRRPTQSYWPQRVTDRGYPSYGPWCRNRSHLVWQAYGHGPLSVTRWPRDPPLAGVCHGQRPAALNLAACMIVHQEFRTRAYTGSAAFWLPPD